ncbi:16143_t:CDS:2, partial [Dentiscutata erythropus]
MLGVSNSKITGAFSFKSTQWFTKLKEWCWHAACSRSSQPN